MKIWALFLIISISTNVNAQCNFITANYIKELANPSHIKSLSVQVPKSAKFAKNALKIFTSNTDNIPPKLKKKFNASVTIEYNFGNCNFKAKIRQSGDWKDHIVIDESLPLLQSLDVKLSEGNILNATKFKLLIPKTRNGRNEILATLILQELGFISPETFEVNVNINGVQSVMLFQEKAAKELLEKNLRREGPIFEGDESLLWSYQNYRNFELEPLSLARLVNGNWFDKGYISQKITIGAFEQLQKSYLDYAYSKKIENNHYAIFPNYGKNKIFSNYHFVVMAMNGNHSLRPHNRQYFFNSIEGYFEPIYYDGNVSFNTQDFCCENDLFSIKPSKNFMIKAMKLEKSKLLKKKFIERTKFDQNSEVFFVKSMKQFTKNLVDLNSLIKSATRGRPKRISKSGQNHSWYKKFQTEKKVDQYIINQIYIDKLKSQILLDNESSSKISTASLSKILTKNSLDKERFVFLPLNTKEVSNEQFKIIKIDTKIIKVSKNMQVKLNKSNKQIQFTQSDPADWALLLSGDYSDWSLVFSGKKNYKKTFNPPEQRFNGLGLTGCLTFYKTKINNAHITVNNGECEDSVNFIRSFGVGVIIDVKNSFADAVDADFSKLTISDLKVINAGNDCLDVSKGFYSLNSARLTNCKDKAISVGEMSTFRGNIISVDKAKIGVSSKDFSNTIINTLNLNEVVLCGESKQKKQEFGGARLQIFYNNCAFSFEQDSESLILNSNS